MRTKELNPDAGEKPTMHESMLYTNSCGRASVAVVGFATGEITAGYVPSAPPPAVTSWPSCLLARLGDGQNFIYYTITNFNPLVLTTVTTTRKIFTTVYSVFRDPSNSLNTMQWSGCAAVFLGALDIVRNLSSCTQPPAPPRRRTPPPRRRSSKRSAKAAVGAARRLHHAPDPSRKFQIHKKKTGHTKNT